MTQPDATHSRPNRTLESHATFLEPATHVAVDVPCVTCGYSLRGLPTDGRCPECGHAVHASTHDRPVPRAPRARREWAWVVLAGLALLLWVAPANIETLVSMRFGSGIGGSAPRLNVPGPKVWAVPMVQRSLGYRPESLGISGTMNALLGLAGVFLITTPHSARSWTERLFSLRRIARWTPVVLVGGWFGFAMNFEGLGFTDIAVDKYTLAAIAGVEWPATVVLYVYLRRVALDLGLDAAARLVLPTLMSSTLLMLVAAGSLGMDWFDGPMPDKHDLLWQATASLYMAACMVTALAMTGIVVRIGVALLRIAWPSRSDAA